MKSTIFEKEKLCNKLNKEFLRLVKEGVDINGVAIVTKGSDLKRKSEEKEKEVSCLEEAL